MYFLCSLSSISSPAMISRSCLSRSSSFCACAEAGDDDDEGIAAAAAEKSNESFLELPFSDLP